MSDGNIAYLDLGCFEDAKAIRGGKKAAFGRLMGETMKASAGKANPQIVKDILTRKLGG